MILSIGRYSVLVLAAALVAFATFVATGAPAPSWAGGKKKIKIRHADVTELIDPDSVVGEAELMRTKKGIAFTVETTGLEEGTGYSLWILIDESDAELPGPPGFERFELRIQKGGSFAAPDGSGEFTGYLAKGDLPDVNGGTVVAIDDGVFNKPMKADIVLLVRWHGELEAGLEYEQTHDLFGGPVTNTSVQEAYFAGGGNNRNNDGDSDSDSDSDSD